MAIQTISTAYNPITGVFGTGQVQMFFASGSWTVPTGISKVRARVWGGGGYALGSGGGFSLKAIYDLTGVISVAVTVGAAGDSTTTTGGTSSFGSYCSATGGVSTGAGGAGSGGDINNTGGASATASAGGGSASLIGTGGRGSTSTPSSGGAGGGAVSPYQGGNGFRGRGGGMVLTTVYPPTSGLEPGFSIDFIGTGGGGNDGGNGINGGGGGSIGVLTAKGGIPGGGGGTLGNGGQGLVIVEW